jgi:class 3 adenylate cyclase
VEPNTAPLDSQPRRLAAILAADIAGYSALMGADEARTVRDLKNHQAVVLPMLSEFGGRIIDTAGDGILAEFASGSERRQMCGCNSIHNGTAQCGNRARAPHAVPDWNQYR